MTSAPAKFERAKRDLRAIYDSPFRRRQTGLHTALDAFFGTEPCDVMDARRAGLPPRPAWLETADRRLWRGIKITGMSELAVGESRFGLAQWAINEYLHGYTEEMNDSARAMFGRQCCSLGRDEAVVFGATLTDVTEREIWLLHHPYIRVRPDDRPPTPPTLTVIRGGA